MSDKLPQPTARLIKRLHRVARVLRNEFPQNEAYAAFANTCDQAAGRLADFTAKHDGIVLSLVDAADIHRMLELYMDDRRFFNPIVALECTTAARLAKERLATKLATDEATNNGEAQDARTGTE